MQVSTQVISGTRTATALIALVFLTAIIVGLI